MTCVHPQVTSCVWWETLASLFRRDHVHVANIQTIMSLGHQNVKSREHNCPDRMANSSGSRLTTAHAHPRNAGVDIISEQEGTMRKVTRAQSQGNADGSSRVMVQVITPDSLEYIHCTLCCDVSNNGFELFSLYWRSSDKLEVNPNLYPGDPVRMEEVGQVWCRRKKGGGGCRGDRKKENSRSFNSFV